ncbi:MAG TPA: iron-sulfur cluster assembly protein, partial [Trebonia sp.]|nr:iron-sulfur cluster assembly protein [Trebonia sp.]
PGLRVAQPDASRALAAVAGQDLVAARARLRYGPGRTCEPLARMLDAAVVRAENAGLDPALLLIAGGGAEAGEDIVRVRRKAHGTADWIHSPTSHVRLTLHPAGLHAAGHTAPGEEPGGRPREARARSEAGVLAGPPAATPAGGGDGARDDDDRPAAVREALFDVLDPDLGVNIVDLGFVRRVAADGRTAVITMTLTSPACPLTRVLEDQIRTRLTGLDGIDDFRVDWVWLPPWQPRDITPSGREQLHAIGFTV